MGLPVPRDVPPATTRSMGSAVRALLWAAAVLAASAFILRVADAVPGVVDGPARGVVRSARLEEVERVAGMRACRLPSTIRRPRVASRRGSRVPRARGGLSGAGSGRPAAWPWLSPLAPPGGRALAAEVLPPAVDAAARRASWAAGPRGSRVRDADGAVWQQVEWQAPRGSSRPVSWYPRGVDGDRRQRARMRQPWARHGPAGTSRAFSPASACWSAWASSRPCSPGLDRLEEPRRACRRDPGGTAERGHVGHRHLDGVVAREWSKLQEVATGPGIAAHHDDAASQALVLAALRTSYLRAELMHDTYVTDADGRVRLQEPHAGPAGPGVLPGARRRAARPGGPTATGAGERPERSRRCSSSCRSATGRARRPAWSPARSIREGSRFAARPRGAQRPVERRFDRRHRQCGRHPRQHRSGPPGQGERPPSAPGQPHPDRRLDPRHLPQLSRGIGAPHHRPDGVRLGQVASAGACGSASRSRSRSARTRPGCARRCWRSARCCSASACCSRTGRPRACCVRSGVLTRTAERIAAGDMEPPIPDLGADEVGRLGRSLEHMRTHGSSRSMDDIEDANAMLERRVDERTRRTEGALRAARRARRGAQPAAPPGDHGPGGRAQAPGPRTARRDLPDDQRASTCASKPPSQRLPPGADSAPLLEARALAVRTLDELHRLIYDLRPSVLDDLGLWSAIQWYADRQLKPRGVAVQLRVHRRRAPAAADHGNRPLQGGAGSRQQHRQARGRGTRPHPVRLRARRAHDRDRRRRQRLRAVGREAPEGRGPRVGPARHHGARRGAGRHSRASTPLPGQGARIVITVPVPPEGARA